MQHTTETEPAERTEPAKSRGYLAAVIGADVGFVIGFITGIFLGAVQLPAILTFDPSAILALLTALFAVILGGYVGGLIGCLLALSMTGQRRVGRTVLFLAVLYPLPLLLAGSDLFIGALIVPLLARYLALRDF